MEAIKLFRLILLLLFLPFPAGFVFAKGDSCFLPGTLITMGDGSQQPIENVKAGDKIVSYDQNLNPVITKVLETESPIRDDYYAIAFENGKELKVTDEHPLYVKSGKYEGWGSIIPEAAMEDANIKTKKIGIGDSLLNIEKKWIKIVNIKHVNEKVQTYNLKKVDKTNTFFAEGFLAHNKGEPPPPPPPPCPIQSAGCYKIGDLKTGFGEMITAEFGYYLSESKCKSDSSCDCRGVPIDIPKQINPDESSGACACIAGTDWNARGRCCGDDSDDCGKISTGVLCSIDANAASAGWLLSTQSLGDIKYVGCVGAEYLSDGNNWRKCDGSFWRHALGGSEYMCIGNGRESIAECCGDGSCKSRSNGKRLSTGQSVNPEEFKNVQAQDFRLSGTASHQECGIIKKTDCEDIKNCGGEAFLDFQCSSKQIQSCERGPPEICHSITVFDCEKEVCVNVLNQVTGNVVSGVENSKTYYCRPDRKFATDLDVSDSQTSDKALIGKNKATCEKAGFVWTGTKCCSEDDDANEHYSDPNGLGGCWDKKPIASISFVEGTDDSVVNYNGEFHGCALDKSNFNRNNDDLPNLADVHTAGQLITNHNYCFNEPENNYYCSYTEKWLPTEGADKTHVSFAPLNNPKQTAECCAKTECWDGSQCIANQKSNPLAQPIGNSSRCIDGEWTESEIKVSVDGNVPGYCPSGTQCLANAFGAGENNQCINSSSYIGDNYCENGVWSSRTKLLALKLLKIRSGDFTLFCDSRENSLNHLQYLTGSGEIVSNVLSNLQVNNFCVLKTGSNIIAATSINKNLEDVPASSLNIFGVTDCGRALIDDGQYHSCDGTNKAWFNKRLKSFIYSSGAITVPSDQESSSFIVNLIKSIIDSIKRLISPPPFDESYVGGINKFNKIYMAQQGDKIIRGTVKGATFKNAVIEYTGFDTDICNFVGQYSQAKSDVSSGISCKKEGNTYYVLAQGGQLTNINPESIWPDLTSKLRLG